MNFNGQTNYILGPRISLPGVRMVRHNYSLCYGSSVPLWFDMVYPAAVPRNSRLVQAERPWRANSRFSTAALVTQLS